jgi:uncharacterized membrane protein
LSAELAVEALKGWDHASEDIKLGALAVVSKNEQGEIETTRLGARNTGPGAEIGVIVGVVVALLSGGLTLVGGTILGMAAGAGIGALSKQGIGLTQEDMDHMKSELEAGHAAVLAMVDEAEVAGTTAELARIGGRVQVHPVDLETVAQAEKALDALTSGPVSTTKTEGSE